MWPPSTTIVWPTTYDAESEQSHTAAWLISFGVANCPSGIGASNLAKASAFLGMFHSNIGVRTVPGHRLYKDKDKDEDKI